MTDVIPFSREQLDLLEPYLDDTIGRGRSYLSPFAVPDSFTISMNLAKPQGKDCVGSVELQYESNPKPLGEPVLIDEIRDPAIAITFSAGVDRVLKVAFFNPVEFEQLRTFGPRLRKFADKLPHTGKRLSVLFVANLFEGSIFRAPLPELLVAQKSPGGETPPPGQLLTT